MVYCDIGLRECSHLKSVEVLGGYSMRCEMCGCSIGMMKEFRKPCPLEG